MNDTAPDEFDDVLSVLKRTEISMPATLEASVATALAEPAPPARVQGVDAAIRRDADEAWSLALAFLGDEEAAWESIVDGFLRLGRGKCVGISLADTLRAQAEAGLEVVRLLAKSGVRPDVPGAVLAPEVRMGILLRGGLGQRDVLLDGAPALEDALVSAFPQAGGVELCRLLAAELLGSLAESERSELEALRLAHPTSARLVRERYAEVAQVAPHVLARRDELARSVHEQLAREAEQSSRLGTVQLRVTVSCSYCHDGLGREEAVFCSGCLAPHHEECFREHGRCSAAGCGATEIVRPTSPTPSEAPEPATLPRKRSLKGLLAIPLVLLGGLGAAALNGFDDDGEGRSQAKLAPPVYKPDPRLIEEALERAAKSEAARKVVQAQDEALLRVLESKRITVDWDQVPFSECVDWLRAHTGLNYALTTDARDLIENEGTQVKLTLTDVSLKNALYLLAAANESLGVRLDRGVVVICTDDAEDELLLEVYDVREIISGATRAKGGFALDAEHLVELLDSTLGDAFAEGSIEVSSGTLVVRRARGAHERIQKLLAYLQGARAEDEAPVRPGWIDAQEELLSKTISVDFADPAPISSVIGHLREVTGARFVLDAAVEPDETLVSVTLREVPARHVLRFVLQQARLGRVFRNEAIVITTRDGTRPDCLLRILNTGDIETWLEADSLVSLVQNAVGEEEWDAPAWVQSHREQLIVFQTPEVLAAIRDVLAKLRVTRAQSQAGEKK